MRSVPVSDRQREIDHRWRCVEMRVRAMKVGGLPRFPDSHRCDLTVRQALGVLDRGCEVCGKSGPLRELHLDHAIPPRRGGHSTLANMRCLCAKCNVIKGILTWDEFLPAARDMGLVSKRKPKPRKVKPYRMLVGVNGPMDSTLYGFFRPQDLWP